ncbi:hypothetical protein DQ04_10021020, partial [Trypanosoma grayi]|uniref:hypothetical protein n=1 Tax=Trypanosoma grayi TaxID=71804 RepID=UPI0004F4BCC8
MAAVRRVVFVLAAALCCVTVAAAVESPSPSADADADADGKLIPRPRLRQVDKDIEDLLRTSEPSDLQEPAKTRTLRERALDAMHTAYAQYVDAAVRCEEAKAESRNAQELAQEARTALVALGGEAVSLSAALKKADAARLEAAAAAVECATALAAADGAEETAT